MIQISPAMIFWQLSPFLNFWDDAMGYHERPDRRGGVGGPKQLLGKPANCTGNRAGRRGKPSAVLLFGTRQASARPFPRRFAHSRPLQYLYSMLKACSPCSCAALATCQPALGTPGGRPTAVTGKRPPFVSH